MLSKAHIKACLAGQAVTTVPANLFWLDGKFVEKNRAEVARMRERHTDDFVQCGVELKQRATGGRLQPGEFADEWGCLFGAAPDGVGAHPTRPIIGCVEDWERYVASGMPEVDRETFAKAIQATVSAEPDHYVAACFWRTFYERMYMLAGFENLQMLMAEDADLFRRMLADLRDFTLKGIELIAEAKADAVFLADDWGMQDRLQVSPQMWRRYFRPAYAAMIETAHSKGLQVWFHSCGNVTALIPEFVDLRLDVLGHLQAAALDLPAIARAYRGKITFLGGIDVQFNVVNGSRDTIRNEVGAFHFS